MSDIVALPDELKLNIFQFLYGRDYRRAYCDLCIAHPKHFGPVAQELLFRDIVSLNLLRIDLSPIQHLLKFTEVLCLDMPEYLVLENRKIVYAKLDQLVNILSEANRIKVLSFTTRTVVNNNMWPRIRKLVELSSKTLDRLQLPGWPIACRVCKNFEYDLFHAGGYFEQQQMTDLFMDETKCFDFAVVPGTDVTTARALRPISYDFDSISVFGNFSCPLLSRFFHQLSLAGKFKTKTLRLTQMTANVAGRALFPSSLKMVELNDCKSSASVLRSLTDHATELEVIHFTEMFMDDWTTDPGPLMQLLEARNGLKGIVINVSSLFQVDIGALISHLSPALRYFSLRVHDFNALGKQELTSLLANSPNLVGLAFTFGLAGDVFFPGPFGRDAKSAFRSLGNALTSGTYLRHVNIIVRYPATPASKNYFAEAEDAFRDVAKKVDGEFMQEGFHLVTLSITMRKNQHLDPKYVRPPRVFNISELRGNTPSPLSQDDKDIIRNIGGEVMYSVASFTAHIGRPLQDSRPHGNGMVVT